MSTATSSQICHHTGKYVFPHKNPWKSFSPVSTSGYRKGLGWFRSSSVFPMISGGIARDCHLIPLASLVILDGRNCTTTDLGQWFWWGLPGTTHQSLFWNSIRVFHPVGLCQPTCQKAKLKPASRTKCNILCFSVQKDPQNNKPRNWAQA